MNGIKFLTSLSLAVFLFFLSASSIQAVVVKTAGDLELVLDQEPLFGSGIVWMPGQSRSANFVVRNKSGGDKNLQVEAFNTSQTGNLAEKMYLRFIEGGVDLYGGGDSKTMKNFWDDGEVFLSSVPSGEERTYTMTVAMAAAAVYPNPG